MTAHHAETRRVAWGAWSRLIVASLARVLLLSIIGGLFWSVAPSLIGWRPTTVMSDSMVPRFFTGDVAVSMPATPQLENIGAILLVDDPDHIGRLRLHRMIGVDDAGKIITKGDANPTPDSGHIATDHVRGVAVLRVPFVGLPIAWAKSHQWGLIAAAAVGMLALVLLATIDSDLRSNGSAAAPVVTTRRALRRQRRRARVVPATLLVGSASTVALVLAITTGAHAAFAASTANPASTWSASAAFTCWSTTAPTNTPYFYYRFNTTATLGADSSANGRTGALLSGATGAAGTCPAGGTTSPALNFDGTINGQVVPASTAAITGPNTFSIEAWFTTTTAGGKLIGFGDSKQGTSGSYDRHLYIGTDGKVYFGVYPNAVKTLVSPTALNNGAWHHVVATLSTAGMRLYIDGALVGSDTTTIIGQAYSGYWRIGYDNLASWTNAGGLGFVGTMDNVAVYTTALTAAQVSAKYATGH